MKRKCWDLSYLITKFPIFHSGPKLALKEFQVWSTTFFKKDKANIRQNMTIFNCWNCKKKQKKVFQTIMFITFWDFLRICQVFILVVSTCKFDQIRKTVEQFPWEKSFRNLHINEMVYLFNKTIKNLPSNYIPHETINCNDRD